MERVGMAKITGSSPHVAKTYAYFSYLRVMIRTRVKVTVSI